MKRPHFAPLLLLAATGACSDLLGRPDAPVQNYQVGSEVRFNVQFGSGRLCSDAHADFRTGRVVAVSDRAVVVADVRNPQGGFTDDEYRAYAEDFDRQVWPAVTAAFGEPHDLDGNQRVVIFFTRAVNELTPEGQSWFVGGLFASRDLFPRRNSQRLSGCAGSNEAEMMYMLVPDPAGEVNGNVRQKSHELHRTAGVLAHELQHLVNASRRLHGSRTVPAEWSEALWLNEGLSQVAEELVAHATSSLGPRQNLDMGRIVDAAGGERAMSLYLYPNLHNLASYLEHPEAASLHGADGLPARGAAWLFLRYAADRRGGSEAAFWRGLVDSGSSGFDNLGAALGADPAEWIHDWLVSLYVDDLFAGMHPRFVQPSWNLRSLYVRLRTPAGFAYGRYPLRAHALSDGADDVYPVAAGSALYFRFRVAPLGRAAVRTGPGGGSCGAASGAEIGVGTMLTFTEEQAQTVCLDGGAAGAEYAYVVAHTGAAGMRSVRISASGVSPPESGSPAPDSAHDAPARDARSSSAAAVASEWEADFRRRENAELANLVGREQMARRSSGAPAPAAGIRATLIRVR